METSTTLSHRPTRRFWGWGLESDALSARERSTITARVISSSNPISGSSPPDMTLSSISLSIMISTLHSKEALNAKDAENAEKT